MCIDEDLLWENLSSTNKTTTSHKHAELTFTQTCTSNVLCFHAVLDEDSSAEVERGKAKVQAGKQTSASK